MEDQGLKWWHVRWRLAGNAISRFAIVFGKIIGSLCLIAAVGYGVIYSILPWLAAKWMRKFDPQLCLVPVNLPTKARVPLSNRTIDRYGFRVSLPNEEITKTFENDLITVVLFRNGGSIIIHNTSQDFGILKNAIGNKYTERLVGQEVAQSKLKLLRAVMWATPEQVKWWRFRTLENERILYLVLMKLSVLTSIASSRVATSGPIYPISASAFYGFQIGDPEVSPYEAHVDLFDRTDGYFAFDVIRPGGHGQVLTQAEINAMVASVRTTPDR